MRGEFKNRINKLFTNPLLGDLLDNGEIDYALLDVFEEFVRHQDVYIAIQSKYAKQEFMRYPVIKALLDSNILYKSKYYDQLYVEHQLYNEVLKEWVTERKDAMNGFENASYKLYRKVKGLKFGSLYSGVPNMKAK